LERRFDGQDAKPPVKLVVFDCDETLTLSTFMPPDDAFMSRIGVAEKWNESSDYISEVNFESPFAEGSRIKRLQSLLDELANGCDGSERVLSILTRNKKGPIACLNLLSMAGLAHKFSAIWTMPAKSKGSLGVFKHGVEWRTFEPPVGEVADHKADVLRSVAESPQRWLPQMSKGELTHLTRLRPEEIVLVDDSNANFQSPFTAESRMLRYCQVAHHRGYHPQIGFMSDMGGIGATSLADYETLARFVREPWEFREPEGVA